MMRVEVVCMAEDGSEQRRQVLTMERQELSMETLGLSLQEGKALLAGVQDFVVQQQARQALEQRRSCDHCGQRHKSKDAGHTPVQTVFGPVRVPNPRWERCRCQTQGPRTFRPMRTWLKERSTPEMRCLETRWSCLIPYQRTVDLLQDVLPVGEELNAETVRNHLQATAERMERELGEERPPNQFEGAEEDWEQQPRRPSISTKSCSIAAWCCR